MTARIEYKSPYPLINLRLEIGDIYFPILERRGQRVFVYKHKLSAELLKGYAAKHLKIRGYTSEKGWYDLPTEELTIAEEGVL